MKSWGFTFATCGIIAANALLLVVRAFARDNGLKVQWLSRSYAPERAHLRKLASSDNQNLARRARLYLRLEILAWIVAVSSIAVAVWGWLTNP
jgi:hypothetical protein